MIKFIADIGSNHNGSFSRCEALIHEAKKIGCWGVKFQLYKANKLYNPSNKPSGMDGTELPEDWIPEIKKICNELKIYFGCSPFDLNAVEILASHVDFLKIASYEILRDNLLIECAKTGLPIHVSTGFASMEEITDAICTIKLANSFYDDIEKIVLYHCIPMYPAEIRDCNLSRIIYFKETYVNQKNYVGFIGWSDHSNEDGIIYQAVINGASFIEFHFDLDDKMGRETPLLHVWPSRKIKKIISTLQDGAIGNHTTLPIKQIKEIRLLRSDPTDGMRPHKELRK